MKWPTSLPAGWVLQPVNREYEVVLGKMLDKKNEGKPYYYHKAATVQDSGILHPAFGLLANSQEAEELAVHKGDLLVCEGGDVARSAIVEIEPSIPTIFQNSLHRVRSRGRYSVEYLQVILQFIRNSKWIDLFVGKNTISHFTKETFSSLLIPYPPPEQANAIASEIIKKSNNINKIIDHYYCLVERIEDYRQSLITQVVTKGLNPNAPMKDSGLPWLGNIPDHWPCMRLACCFSPVSRAPKLDLPVLSVSIHTGISDTELNDEDRDRKVWLSEDRSKYQGICSGDLVYNMMRAWQGGFGTSTRAGLVSPAYTVLQPMKGILSKYYELLFRTTNAQKLIYGYSQGIADFRKRLYWEKARDIYVPVPPIEEQVQIVSWLNDIDKKVNTLTTKIENQINLLIEHRKSIISSTFIEKKCAEVMKTEAEHD